MPVFRYAPQRLNRTAWKNATACAFSSCPCDTRSLPEAEAPRSPRHRPSARWSDRPSPRSSPP